MVRMAMCDSEALGALGGNSVWGGKDENMSGVAFCGEADGGLGTNEFEGGKITAELFDTTNSDGVACDDDDFGSPIL